MASNKRKKNAAKKDLQKKFEKKNSVKSKSELPSIEKLHGSKNMSLTPVAGENSSKFDRKRILISGIWAIVTVITFALVDLLVQYLNNDYSAAIVNGTRISRSDFHEKLVEAQGDAVIDQMITEALVRGEAKEKDVKVDKEKLDEEINKTKELLGGDEAFKEALESYNITEEIYRRDLEIKLLAEALVVPNPTEDELKAFYESSKTEYFADSTSYEEVKSEVKDLYISTKFNEESTSWLEELKADSKIQNNIDKKPKYGFFTTTKNIVENLRD